MNLSIVIPIFNEEESILPLYEQLTSVLRKFPDIDKYELVFVDDGSTDSSAKRLDSIPDPQLKVTRLKTRSGQSAAFHQGIQAAAFDTIATLDGDLQNDPENLPGMISLLKQGVDFVQGWRMPRQDPFLKRICSILANAVHQRVLQDHFHDISCSQRVFKKKCVKEIDFFPGAHRLLPYLVQEAGYKVVECKVGHYPRLAGYSKYGVLNRSIQPLKDLVRLALLKKYPRTKMP